MLRKSGGKTIINSQATPDYDLMQLIKLRPIPKCQAVDSQHPKGDGLYALDWDKVNN